ncbi:putative neutral sphingomyelinase [Pseudolycoriella hygida]|uniref:sphingomyelin phosphodiesterase n=1 Tax=Pseudolycoriella hygida TaxID=35572 RepID=A0A9Q0S730_9DIPT|nr:putative neutral sphingomyelinase [Pseudolycoriella hygida]
MISVIELSILTLNIWGIPLISKDRNLRVAAIGMEIAKGDYDVVSLQEVWSNDDFEYIRRVAQKTLPFSHYFHSGVIGSGLCILSKYPITMTLFHSWSVNGYVHRIQHGDWFGGKGVGLCQIMVQKQLVNIYIAHLHAEYDRNSDDYKAHRIIQSFDTAQFIESTRGDSILQVLAGDLNTEPGDLAHRLLLYTSKLTETCDNNIPTCDNPTNSYTPQSTKESLSNGKRIDYILYRSGRNCKTDVLEYKLPLSHPIPDHPISFSDHEAVSSRIRVTIPENVLELKQNLTSTIENGLIDALTEAIVVCEENLEKLRSHKTVYFSMALAVMMTLFYLIDMVPPYGLQTLFTVLRVIVSGLVLFFIAMATLWNSIEVNGILSGKLAMEISLKNAADSETL